MKKLVCMLILISLFLGFANVATSAQTDNIVPDASGELEEKAMFAYHEKYAVIIVGTYGAKNQVKISGNSREQYYYWFTGSAQRRFNLLTEKYGFNADNIYVLLTEVHKDGYIPHEIFDPSEFNINNYYNATKDNISKVFNELKSKIENNDLLVVDLIGHGGDDHTHSFFKLLVKLGLLKSPLIVDFRKGVRASDTYMALEKENYADSYSASILRNQFFGYVNGSSSDYSLYDHELASYTNDIDARRVLYILQPCFSGGFINDLSKNNHVIITSSKEAEMAGDFLGPLNNGFDGSADLNEDGRISLSEVFDYAVTHINHEVEGVFHPLLDDNGDKIGSVDLTGADGQISSKIYDLSYEEI